jgi:NAD(P)-dependent dehydrogenase (short-subunit alcohol dehydrogenase family)
MNRQKAVLITGASTGIGKATALYLADKGFKVYAGVRKDDDIKKLNETGSQNIFPIIIDVASSESINNALNQIIKNEGKELFGLINNAGIGCGGALEATFSQDIQNVFNVNVIGMMEVTKAFLPLLRNAKGKIVNIGSTASFLSVPGASVYSASKFAVRALSDSLRRELHPFDIDVVMVAPGAIESEIWNKSIEQKKAMRETIDPVLSELYAPLRKFGDKMANELKKIPAIEVAKAVEEVLKTDKPKPVYVVGKDIKAARKVSRLPAALIDKIIYKRIEKIAGNY